MKHVRQLFPLILFCSVRQKAQIETDRSSNGHSFSKIDLYAKKNAGFRDSFIFAFRNKGMEALHVCGTLIHPVAES